MNYKLNLVLFVFIIILAYSDFGYSQDAGNQQNQNDLGDVVELQTTEIKVVVEKPQVTLFSDRIKPDFDEVKMQKSFIPEIVGKGERFVIKDKYENKNNYVIDVEKMANKQR
jgi:hypothetical protein